MIYGYLPACPINKLEIFEKMHVGKKVGILCA